MLADLREALRQLRKTPGVTTTAVITLTLGIGATTAIFTLVHQVMLKSLPVTKPNELWRIGDKIRCCNWGGYTQGEAGHLTQEDTRNGQDVSGNFFRTLGVQPWIGRLMTEADDYEGAPLVAVMS